MGASLPEALAAFERLRPPPVDGLGSIDHLGIKVPDMEAVWPQLSAHGLHCPVPPSDHPDVGLRVAFLEGGIAPVELLCVTSPQSPLAGDADGLHHVAYRMAGLRAVFERLRHDGRFLLIGEVRRGGRGHDILTFRLRADPTVAFELVEAGR